MMIKEIDVNQNSREDLLSRNPEMLLVFEPYEKIYGLLQYGGTVGSFKDGRYVFFFAFATHYLLVFYNENNEKGEQERDVVLSQEAMYAVFAGYSLFGDSKRDLQSYKNNSTPVDKEEVTDVDKES